MRRSFPCVRHCKGTTQTCEKKLSGSITWKFVFINLLVFYQPKKILFKNNFRNMSGAQGPRQQKDEPEAGDALLLLFGYLRSILTVDVGLPRTNLYHKSFKKSPERKTAEIYHKILTGVHLASLVEHKLFNKKSYLNNPQIFAHAAICSAAK